MAHLSATRIAVDVVLACGICVSGVFGAKGQDVIIGFVLLLWTWIMMYIPDKLHASYRSAAQIHQIYILLSYLCLGVRCAVPYLGMKLLGYVCSAYPGTLTCIMDPTLFGFVASLRVVINLSSEASAHLSKLAVTVEARDKLETLERHIEAVRAANHDFQDHLHSLRQDIDNLKSSFRTCVLTVSSHKTAQSNKLSRIEAEYEELRKNIDELSDTKDDDQNSVDSWIPFGPLSLVRLPYRMSNRFLQRHDMIVLESVRTDVLILCDNVNSVVPGSKKAITNGSDGGVNDTRNSLKQRWVPQQKK